LRPLTRVLRVAYRIVAATLVLLLALELGARLSAGVRAPSSSTRAEKGSTRAEKGDGSPEDPVAYTLHPYFQLIPPPSAKTLRGPFLAGWRVDPPEAAQAKGRLRILFLGGSTTANEYPELVRTLLESKLGPTTVYNLAFDWHCSLHSLYKVWTYADDIRPDLVVAMEGINDFYRGFTPTRLSLREYRPDYSHYVGGLYAWWRRGTATPDGREAWYSRFVDPPAAGEPIDASFGGLCSSIVRESVFLRALGLGRAPRTSPAPRSAAPLPSETLLRSLPDYERNMRNLADSCRGKGLPLLLLTMPYATGFPTGFLQRKGFFTNDDEHVLAPEEFAKGMERFNQATLALRDEPAVHAFALADRVRDKRLFEDEVHLTFDGLKLEAILVAEYIVEQKLLSEPRNR
jgi:lysophospholipase L1-like esterase